MLSSKRANPALWGLSLAVVLLASLFGRPDIPIDETRYLSVAWEAWQGGDWLIMHMNGQPYHHKPPLLFWLIGLGWSVFGVNDWWPRSISALASLACVLLTAQIAARLWPDRHKVPAAAGWLLLTGIYWLLFSTSVMFDVLLTAFTLLALRGVLDVWRRGGWRGWLWCGVGLGLGVLTKGPFVLLFVLPVAVAGPWWGGERASGKAWWRGLLAAGALGAAIALLWVIPAAIFGGEEFRNAILWGQVAGRVSGELAHRQPIWFYFAAGLVLVFPLVLSRQAWRAAIGQGRQRADSGTRFLACWSVPAFIALSLAGGKQFHYVLPLWPAVALLLAAGWEQGAARRGGLWLLPVVVAGLGGALLAFPLWAGKHWFAAYAGPSWSIGGGLLIVLALVLAVVSRLRRDVLPATLALFAMAVTSVLLLLVVRPFSPAFDMTPLAAKLSQLEKQGVELVHVSAYNDQYRFYGRLERPLSQISRDELAVWFAGHPESRAIVYLKDPADLAKLDADFSRPYLSGGVALIGARSAGQWSALRK
ncbi:ArnT family glycosyltransferase [Dechloromonas denitrificans]|uniref:ArnT family glycosyltransferase n=1 Tax=Dechloromonas denitrificans TaxID=281362 RepID=UPI001CFA2876|nr:glycosyltransferase family 39 protein [Dechloromonas denitrificans]UCV09395.1 glycosyltransferase family 39 protein [Dechloromonas denitrificans]